MCASFCVRTWKRRWFYALATISLLPSGIATADVLYDTTWMTEAGSYDSILNCYIGGAAENAGNLRDGQVADDFELDNTYVITGVRGDFTNNPPPAVPADGILVEFFEDIRGTPSEEAFVQVFAEDFVDSAFEDPVFGHAGHRFTIDLSGSGITLGAGVWWLSIIPVDETRSGMRYFQIQTAGLNTGHPTHGRDGGIPHGNGYNGVGYGPVWFDLSIVGLDGDIAMRIEGHRSADLDGDGSVGAADLLMLLAAWGECPPKEDCVADLNDDGAVGASDLLTLLSQWG